MELSKVATSTAIDVVFHLRCHPSRWIKGTLLDLLISSYPTEPLSLIANLFQTSTNNPWAYTLCRGLRGAWTEKGVLEPATWRCWSKYFLTLLAFLNFKSYVMSFPAVYNYHNIFFVLVGKHETSDCICVHSVFFFFLAQAQTLWIPKYQRCVNLLGAVKGPESIKWYKKWKFVPSGVIWCVPSFGVYHNIENNYSNSLQASRGLISGGITRFLHAGFGHGLKHIHTRVSWNPHCCTHHD